MTNRPGDYRAAIAVLLAVWATGHALTGQTQTVTPSPRTPVDVSKLGPQVGDRVSAMRPHAIRAKEVAQQPSIRLLTLLVSTEYAYSNGVLVRASLRHVAGVHTVVADPRSQRVWVFADGSVDVQVLSDALARWSFRVDVLDDCVIRPA